jgi:hypothetical protein
MFKTTPRDWPEDAAHENGRYYCICIYCTKVFTGRKRRIVCKLCHRRSFDLQWYLNRFNTGSRVKVKLVYLNTLPTLVFSASSLKGCVGVHLARFDDDSDLSTNFRQIFASSIREARALTNI